MDINDYEFVFTIKNSINDERFLFSSDMLVDGDNGMVSLSMTPAQTSLLRHGDAVYDIKMTKPSGDVATILSGSCVISRVVTE